jgi:hypothetical protein
LKQQPGAYLIQHYGLIGGEVTQHFTETWSLLPDGRWRQDVGPSRYTCISEVRMGQLHCSSPGAAKPTRDQREIYDLLNRVSTIQITPNGWVQKRNETTRLRKRAKSSPPKSVGLNTAAPRTTLPATWAKNFIPVSEPSQRLVSPLWPLTTLTGSRTREVRSCFDRSPGGLRA